MPNVARNLRSREKIRGLFESQGLKYIMVNNKIMDLYQQGYYDAPIYEKDEDGVNRKTGEFERIKFDSRNLVLYIGLQLLNKMEFWGYEDEIADFVNMSKKRIKNRLEDLQKIELPMNNKLNKSGENELLEQPRMFQLVKKHIDRGFERNRRVKTYRWYTPFDCDKKEVVNPETKKKELQAVNYFMVTIYDFDLYVNGVLDEHEFALYLYLVQCFNSSSKDKKGIAQTVSKIAENLNVKNHDVMQRRLDKLINVRVTDKFCSEGEDFPLLQTTKPKNFNHKLVTRQEPSLHYYPIYNDTTIQKIRSSDEDTDINKMDTELMPDSDLNNKDIENCYEDISHPF